MATRYCACFVQTAGFAKVITAENSRQCPDALQYLGRIVNDIESNVLVRTYRFPKNDDLLVGVDALAPAAATKSPLPPEPILFGKWRDYKKPAAFALGRCP
jgi:hypothetical protein